MTLALVTKGIPVTLIEAEADAVEDQRAATVHPPTVEMLAKLGLKEPPSPRSPPAACNLRSFTSATASQAN